VKDDKRKPEVSTNAYSHRDPENPKEKWEKSNMKEKRLARRAKRGCISKGDRPSMKNVPKNRT